MSDSFIGCGRFDEPFVFWSSQVQDVFNVHGRPKRRARG